MGSWYAYSFLRIFAMLPWGIIELFRLLAEGMLYEAVCATFPKKNGRSILSRPPLL
jgi:hypothetical protein